MEKIKKRGRQHATETVGIGEKKKKCRKKEERRLIRCAMDGGMNRDDKVTTIKKRRQTSY